jgi:energy-coupling factor transporter ATP-binding protein EcfA2
MDLLRVEGLQVRYPIHKEPSIKDVSFIMKKGELVLLTGKSGCGKSTLLKCINLTIPHFIQAENQIRSDPAGDTKHQNNRRYKS